MAHILNINKVRPFTLLKFYFSKCLKIQDKVKRRHSRRLVDLYAEQAQPKKTHTGLAFQNKLIQNMEKNVSQRALLKKCPCWLQCR